MRFCTGMGIFSWLAANTFLLSGGVYAGKTIEFSSDARPMTVDPIRDLFYSSIFAFFGFKGDIRSWR